MSANISNGVFASLVAESLSWLREIDDPTVNLFLATKVDGMDLAACGQLVEAVVASDRVRSAFSAQNADGSWGAPNSDPRRRILSTLHTLHTMAVLGAGSHRDARRAVAFLSSLAHTDEGIFSIDGKRDGVLSCYVGTAAATYLLCGETSAAQPQIGWILRYQDVSRRGEALRVDLAEHWGPYLRTRYGGCMADTTCLVGLAKVGRALQLHAADPSGDVEPLRIAIREAFLERQLMFDRDEHVVPLGVVASKATDWLLPTFPLDWRTDLIEVLDVVGKSGPFDPRMQPAIDSLMSWRLPDGSWPLRRSFWPNDVTIRERRSTQTGHPIVTLRALSALRTCHDAE